MTTAPIELENITESLQSYLGIQQAQTAFPQDITADTIARLLKQRGDVSTLQLLWGASEDWRDLIEDWQGESDKAAVLALRRVLDRSLVVQRFANGVPKTFLPLSTRFISNERVNSLYRDLGRSVVEGLWGLPELAKVKGEVASRVGTWGEQHPLAILLKPLCKESKIETSKGSSRMLEAISRDSELTTWVKATVAQDWKAWLAASAGMSVDEQLETMTSLIGLHLHVALLWRLGAAGSGRLPPAFFIDLVGDNALCKHAAYQCFVFWRERVRDALAEVATAALAKFCDENAAYKAALATKDWSDPGIRGWATVGIASRGKATKASNEFKSEVTRRLDEQRDGGASPAEGDVLELLREALVTAFSGPSGTFEKTKVYLRMTGQAAGIVGPREAPRKRYHLDEAGLSLLARLHVYRGEDVHTTEEELASVEAFIDDIGVRYGLIVTLERERLRDQLEDPGDVARALRRHFPAEQAMTLNRQALERRLESMRLLRRYSDASAVIQIP